MMELIFSIFRVMIINFFIPAVLLCVQVKLTRKGKMGKSFLFIVMIVLILVMNYIFLMHNASIGNLKKLSLDLQNGNRAEMYVRENRENEIIACTPLKIINDDGIVMDEEEPLQRMRYERTIAEMTDGRSLVNTVCETEEILANAKNVFLAYKGGAYIISAEILLKHLIIIISALILIWKIRCFLYDREQRIIAQSSS